MLASDALMPLLMVSGGPSVTIGKNTRQRSHHPGVVGMNKRFGHLYIPPNGFPYTGHEEERLILILTDTMHVIICTVNYINTPCSRWPNDPALPAHEEHTRIRLFPLRNRSRFTTHSTYRTLTPISQPGCIKYLFVASKAWLACWGEAKLIE